MTHAIRKCPKPYPTPSPLIFQNISAYTKYQYKKEAQKERHQIKHESKTQKFHNVCNAMQIIMMMLMARYVRGNHTTSIYTYGDLLLR